MQSIEPAHTSSVDLMTLLLVLAGDHQASARANALALLRLAETVSAPEPPHHKGQPAVVA